VPDVGTTRAITLASGARNRSQDAVLTSIRDEGESASLREECKKSEIGLSDHKSGLHRFLSRGG